MTAKDTLMTDARAAAWLTAWDCLLEADRCRTRALGEGRPNPDISEAYRDEMQRLQRQAELFIALTHRPGRGRAGLRGGDGTPARRRTGTGRT